MNNLKNSFDIFNKNKRSRKIHKQTAEMKMDKVPIPVNNNSNKSIINVAAVLNDKLCLELVLLLLFVWLL